MVYSYYPYFGMIIEFSKSTFKERMWEGCHMCRGWGVVPVNLNSSVFNLKFLRHLCMDLNAITWAEVQQKYLSNDIYGISEGYIVSEKLAKNPHLLTLSIRDKRGPTVYKKNIYPTLYIPPT